MTIAVATARRKVMAAALAGLAGCAAPRPPPCAAAPAGDTAWVVDQGWHTEIALRAADLAGPLGGIRALFPGAATLAFGFGKRGFLLAADGAVEEWLLGPLPGRGVVQVKGIAVPPAEAWPGRAIAVPLPPGGLAGLVAFIHAGIAPDAPGTIRHGSLFLDASRGYSLAFTCNTWTASALRAAGLPIQVEGIVLAGAVLAQLRPLGCAA